MVDPNFTMFWARDIPRHTETDADGGVTEILCIAGALAGTGVDEALYPPPNSWAADPTADLAIWTVKMSPGSQWTLPPASMCNTRRQLFFFQGATLTIDGQIVNGQSSIEVHCNKPVNVINGSEPSEFLMLQGRPIGEPIVQDGPFVMNSDVEIRQAYVDYRQTRFGDWPWPSNAPVHGPDKKKFALRS